MLPGLDGLTRPQGLRDAGDRTPALVLSALSDNLGTRRIIPGSAARPRNDAVDAE
ncbi:hypothetical protein [Methylobacterium sp. 17Sr1-1]|uniref:hypothetical protein n=1 Tax=Methylobacterium sp. 17Sr1-1 TaxID=2202826 RepID=UPI001FE0389B|nr:hypothetical protein [Methylobacterium sp. 17Sr1-1]